MISQKDHTFALGLPLAKMTDGAVYEKEILEQRKRSIVPDKTMKFAVYLKAHNRQMGEFQTFVGKPKSNAPSETALKDKYNPDAVRAALDEKIAARFNKIDRSAVRKEAEMLADTSKELGTDPDASQSTNKVQTQMQKTPTQDAELWYNSVQINEQCSW